MSMAVKNVDLQKVAASTAAASPAAHKDPVNKEKNDDAVKITIAAIENSDENVKAKQNEMRAQEAERERRFREQAEKNFAKTAVKFLDRNSKDSQVDIRFKVVESESGRVVVEYPPDGQKSNEQPMDELGGPGQVINKTV